MPKENDLEGKQDMGGKHGGQAGVPKPEQISSSAQGIVRDEKGQEQPGDKPRAPHAAAKIKAKIRPVIRNKASKRSRLPCMANRRLLFVDRLGGL
ncbi:MAG: hypothetical protein WA303_09585 [Bradyrhizobium sp.]